MKKWKIILMICFITIIAILAIIRIDIVNYKLWGLEDSAKIWNKRTTGLRYEIKWLQKRLDILEISKPTLPEAIIIFNPDIVMQSVVHIETNMGWQGSGSYVGNGLILTAGHIVGGEGYGAMKFTISFEDGTVFESDKFYLEKIADVGFIYIGDCNSPMLIFDDDGFNRGDTAFVYGNPYGYTYSFSVSKGIISSINRDCDGYFGEKIMLQVDAVAYPGCSGGPVVDNEGEIIGVLVGGNYGSECLSLCIKSNICQQAMKTYLSILEMERLE